MKPMFIFYNSSDSAQLKKTSQIQFVNNHDERIQFSMQGLLMNNNYKLLLQGSPTFTLNSYQTKNIKFMVMINNQQNKEEQWDQQQSPLNIKIKARQQFIWQYPIFPIKVFQINKVIELTGLSYETSKSKRISLQHITSVKDWVITDYPNYKDSFKLSMISSKQIYLECIINKHLDFNGHIILYDIKGIAEKYQLQVKIHGKKYEKIYIHANVGESGRTELKLKNGKGPFRVELKNNKMKQFDVNPKQGTFNQAQDDKIYFEYKPVEYNGNKKAEVNIISQYGCYNFHVYGKFPPLK